MWFCDIICLLIINNFMSEPKSEIIIYQIGGVPKVEVTFCDETIWLTQEQLAKLFGVERSVITKHIRNVFKTGELTEKSNVQKMHIPLSDKPVKFYGLDIVISVGYRVNSNRATQFRIWATKVLREHIVRGYTINEKRLKDNQNVKLFELEKAIALLKSTMSNHLLSQPEADGLLRVITEYANSWILLHKFDQGNLAVKSVGKGQSVFFSHEDALAYISGLKNDLIKKKEAGDIFGVERGEGLMSAINSIQQSFGGKSLYPSLSEKAAHLLYFVIKDHPFVDGNKRIASLLFIMFLRANNFLNNKKGEKKINDNALVALALLVAESKPSDKDIMIALITNLLAD